MNYLLIINSLGLGISVLPFLIIFAKQKFGIRASGNYTYKERFQEEFYFTISELIAAGKKVVLAGTLSPYKQEGLISDLAYYLAGAMAIKIDRPDDDMKQLLAKDCER